MNSLLRQQEILNELANILYNSFDGNYETLKCDYEFLKDYNTISTSLSFEKNDTESSFEAPHGVASKNLDLTEELRLLMKEHTGGEWTSFTLTLDADGKATTKFTYPEN